MQTLHSLISSPPHPLNSGIMPIDALFNGFVPGELVVIYAPIGAEVDVIFQSMICSIFKEAEAAPILYFSFQKSAWAVCQNFLLSHLPEEIATWPLYIDDMPLLCQDSLIDTLYSAYHSFAPGLIVVDSLDLLSIPNRSDVKAWEADTIRFETLKTIARKFKVPLLVLARHTGNPHRPKGGDFWAANRYADRVAHCYKPAHFNITQDEDGHKMENDQYELTLFNTPSGEKKQSFRLSASTLTLVEKAKDLPFVPVYPTPILPGNNKETNHWYEHVKEATPF